jgi:hypothetical protein
MAKPSSRPPPDLDSREGSESREIVSTPPARLHERVAAAIKAADRTGDGVSASALAGCASAFGDLLRSASEASARVGLPPSTRALLAEILAL